jgi:hypothetical protein
MKNTLLILVAVSILSCVNSQSQNSSSQGKFDYVEFDSRMAAWKALEIEAYRFTAQSFPWFPAIPVTVTVLPGLEPELTYDQDKIFLDQLEEISRGNPFPPFDGSTIDELFASIRLIILNVNEDKVIRIQYNKEYYYPEEFFTNSVPAAPGGSSGITITHFEFLDNSEEL